MLFRFQLRPTPRWRLATLCALVVGAACAHADRPLRFTVTPLALPGAHGLVMLDYIECDRTGGRLWVPAGDTGSVDVIDTGTDRVEEVRGFPVVQVDLRGRQRTVGPSSVALGDGVAYIGSRADSRICSIDTRTLARGNCIEFAPAASGIAAAPDGLIFIPTTRELWATSGAPPIGIPAADRSIKIFGAAGRELLTPAGRIPLPASAEGYAVDSVHGRFYTNLEETGQTAEIDVSRRAIVSTWRSCDEPSGVAVDARRRLVFVACSDHVIVLDAAHGGAVAGSIATGAGVDNIDYDAETGRLYAAAADAAQLTIARVNDQGAPELVARVPTTKGTRSVVAGPGGSAYLIDPYKGRILKVTSH